LTRAFDTNVCVEILRTRSLLIDAYRVADPADIGLPAIVVAELRLGAARSSRLIASTETEDFVAAHQFLPFSEDESKAYADIRLELERAGTPIGPNDLLIAATAIARNLILVTHNTREFSRVGGLRLEDWQ